MRERERERSLASGDDKDKLLKCLREREIAKNDEEEGERERARVTLNLHLQVTFTLLSFHLALSLSFSSSKKCVFVFKCSICLEDVEKSEKFVVVQKWKTITTEACEPTPQSDVIQEDIFQWERCGKIKQQSNRHPSRRRKIRRRSWRRGWDTPANNCDLSKKTKTKKVKQKMKGKLQTRDHKTTQQWTIERERFKQGRKTGKKRYKKNIENFFKKASGKEKEKAKTQERKANSSSPLCLSSSSSSWSSSFVMIVWKLFVCLQHVIEHDFRSKTTNKNNKNMKSENSIKTIMFRLDSPHLIRNENAKTRKLKIFVVKELFTLKSVVNSSQELPRNIVTNWPELCSTWFSMLRIKSATFLCSSSCFSYRGEKGRRRLSGQIWRMGGKKSECKWSVVPHMP